MIIDGQVDGDIHAIERLELGPRPVKGNLHYGLIETAMGPRSRAACARWPRPVRARWNCLPAWKLWIS